MKTKNIPSILYKYRIWNDAYPFQKRIITDAEIYFSSAEQFNDPFDASLPFRYNDEELTQENLVKKMYELMREQYPLANDDIINKKIAERLQDNIQSFKSGEYWRQLHPKVKKMVNDLFGIFSMSEHRDNLLMWSHYADSHKGFCLGFDSEKIFQASRGMLCSVSYSKDFPKIPLNGNAFENFLKLVATKSEDWKYEDEFRLIKTRMARQAIVLPESTYKEIIFGYNMPQIIKENISEIVLRKFPEIKLFEAFIDNEVFRLNLIPYTPKH